MKFRYFIVSDGENLNFRDFRVLGSHIFGRSGQTRSEICNLKVGQPPIDPPGSIGPLQVEICTYRTGHDLEKRWPVAGAPCPPGGGREGRAFGARFESKFEIYSVFARCDHGSTGWQSKMEKMLDLWSVHCATQLRMNQGRISYRLGKF